MKAIQQSKFTPVCITLLLGGALLASAVKSHAQGATPTSDYTNSFDTAISTASWIYWYGLGFNNTPMTWDASMDAQSNPNSGSLMVALPFGSTGDQGVWFGTFHNQYGYDGTTIYNGTRFTNITFDIHVDPSSPVSSSGDFGLLQVGLIQQGWKNGGSFYGNGLTIPVSATNGWAHLSQTIDQAAAGLDAVAGIDFKYTSYSGYPKSPITFWLDNLKVHLAPVVAAPPSLAAPYKPVTGLNLFSSSGSGDQYQRTNLRLLNNSGVGWLGATTPVTYWITITNFPNPILYPNYQAHIFITTGNPLPDYETAPDYTETNLIFLDIHQNANGTAYASFRYKINEPNSNANVYGTDNGTAGTLITLGASTVLGAWSITFNQDTNVTVAGPGGSTTNFSIATVTAGQFVEPLNVLFGAQPNSAANFGQSVVLANAGISGNASPVSDNFLADASLDTTTWAPLAGDIATVQLITPDSGAWWVKWSLPDSGFGLQTTTNIFDKNSWTTLTGPDASVGPLISFSSSGSRLALVPSSALGPGSVGYFRLIQQLFTKLQVLMPGETSAPGTVSGKTGTPSPQTVGAPLDVTVNAVDSTWHLINTVIDTVHISSSDSSATLPADAALVNGTGTFTVTFNTSGSFTVTASDATDNTKAANAGTSTTVNP